ncbi:hypothetical protein C9374_007451 [Naegleria lovaniensis]|uniref:Shwachman-Bodian-Diamond syndrome protein n=1 Tax=Naegleria lovaniensis TaxID=51637 RepID=A0AA88GH27_NAELO|nr:uncharacterized protein C9374_007451 [Naegleria lovaniensis]KAG2379312.1 hypothetical protein C9374_007451 [Naegleria lovaniensis]
MSKDFSLVKYKKGESNFEVLVKPNTVIAYREGKHKVDDVLYSDEIFANYAKGDKVKEESLKSVFGTTNTREVILKILTDGEYHMSTQERKEKVEQKRRQIIHFIHQNYIDPKTNVCHPVTRIESALDSIKYNIDPFMPADKQVAAIHSKLVEKIPLKKSQIEAEVVVKHSLAGQVIGVCHKHAKVIGQDHGDEGCTVTIEISPGDYDKLINDLNSTTKGDFNFRIAGAAATVENVGSSSDDKKKKKKK